MNRRDSLRVCEARPWGGPNQRRVSRSRSHTDRTGWSPVNATDFLVATSDWRVASDSYRARDMPGLDTSRTPLHTGTAKDLRLLEEGKPLVRPVPSSSVEHLLEDDERYWDKTLWQWRPKPKGRRATRRSVAAATAVMRPQSAEQDMSMSMTQTLRPTRSMLQRSSSGVDVTQHIKHTAETQEIDNMRGGISTMQDELTGDLLSQALARMRKKLVSKFAAMQAFHQMDIDCSGYLDAAEFASALNRLGVKLGKAQSSLVFCSIDVDGSGEIDCEEFLDMVFNPDPEGEAEGAANANDGLAKWSTWVAPVRSPNDPVKYLETSAKMQTRQHDLMRRAPATDSWPSSMLHEPGHRTSAEIERATLAAQPRDLPQINPANHPRTFMKQGGEEDIQAILNKWNDRYRHSKDGRKVSASQKNSAKIASTTREQLRKFEAVAGLREPPSSEGAAKDVHFWMHKDEMKQANVMKLRRFQERAAAADAGVRREQKKCEVLAKQGATRMDAKYFDERSAAEEALAIAEAVAMEAHDALADAEKRYGESPGLREVEQ